MGSVCGNIKPGTEGYVGHCERDYAKKRVAMGRKTSLNRGSPRKTTLLAPNELMTESHLTETPTLATLNLRGDVARESLMIGYEGMPSALLGHLLISSFVIFALWPEVASQQLLTWGALIWVITAIRWLNVRHFFHHWPQVSVQDLPFWQWRMTLLAILQMSAWGSATFLIWPADTAHKAVLVAVMAGLIAAGGIMLAVHRSSFWLYCLPVAVPTMFVLLLDGGRLEQTMAVMVLLFSCTMLFSVHRLTNIFLEGLEVRFKMQALSRIDSLTDLLNRRSFDESFNDAWNQNVRAGQSLGLLLLDVDYFKKFNDSYGHPRGDEALRDLAKVLRRVASRTTDLCARIGGEEFAIVVPATDLEGAQLLARQVIEELKLEAIPHRASPDGLLTVSIGIKVGVPQRGEKIIDFIDGADKALYRAKDNGRNRIEVAPQVPEASIDASDILVDEASDLPPRASPDWQSGKIQ
ncbi:MAG: diguanylate cyclase (GGDEF)-like protein [Candidatus Azotimanducaceae bacterium]